MAQAAIAAYREETERRSKLDVIQAKVADDFWCRLCVDAAIVELERHLLARVTTKPAPIDHQGFTPGGGNIDETGPTALGGPPDVLRKEAEARGYSGHACKNCGNFKVKRTGTCLTCQDCGHNTGCD